MLADDEAAWARAFAEGRITDPAIAAGTGERVALRIPDAVVATVRPGPRPVVEQVLSRGPVVVTDRRVLSLGAPPFEAWWDPGVRSVLPEGSGFGTLVFPTDEAFREGRPLWAVLPPFVLDPGPPSRAALLSGVLTWNRVAGAWRAGRGELDRWVGETAEAVRPQHTSRPEDVRWLVDAVLRLRETMAGGGARVLGFGHPQFEPGERFAGTVFRVQRRRLHRFADRASVACGEFADDRGKLRPEGTLYLTDRRAVLMGNLRRQLAEWRWADLADVRVVSGWAGLRFIASDEDTVDDVVLHVYIPAFAYDMPERKVAEQLVLAEATFVMSTRRDLDAWLARLPERISP